MKKFTKLIFSCAAVAALTAALGTVAFAAKGDVTGTITGDITGTYDATTKTITVTGYTSTGDQSTMLVLNNDAQDVADDDIEAIDQDTTITTIPLDIEDPAEGETDTYYIRIGGSNGEIRTATLAITKEGEAGPAPSTRLLGDVNGKDGIDVIDASGAAKHYAKITLLTGDDLLAADADDNGKVEIIDASAIAKYAVKLTSPVDGQKTVGSKTHQTVE